MMVNVIFLVLSPICHEVGDISHGLLMAKESWWSWGTFNGSTWNQRGKYWWCPINAPFSWPLKTVEPGNLNKGKCSLGFDPRTSDISIFCFLNISYLPLPSGVFCFGVLEASACWLHTAQWRMSFGFLAISIQNSRRWCYIRYQN